MKPWLLPFLRCQECGGELVVADRLEFDASVLVSGTLECAECDLSWPVLAGVPVMLSDPGSYLSSYRESVLASLAERGLASPAALRLIDEFSTGRHCEPLRYGDDWTACELEGGRPALLDSPALAQFDALVEQEAHMGLQSSILEMLGEEQVDAMIEVGPGAGQLSRSLAARCDQLVLLDFSLRSLLCSRDRAAASGAEVGAVLADASDLEMASDCASAVVAANVIDLLDAPERFLASVSRWLVRRGELLICTPEPSLGGEGDEALREMLEATEFRIEEERDGIPWLRLHSPRYSQIYWLQALRGSI